MSDFWCSRSLTANQKDSAGSSTSKESLEEQMKKTVNTALAGLGDNSNKELQGRMASAVSTALSTGFEAVYGSDAPTNTRGRPAVYVAEAFRR